MRKMVTEKVLLIEDLNLTGKTWIAVLEEDNSRMWGKGHSSKMSMYEVIYFFYFRFHKCPTEN